VINRAWIPAILFIAGTLAGCVPAPRESDGSLSSLGGSEVMLVGRVELDPPLRKGEQKISGIVIGNIENRIFLITDEQARPLPRDLALKDYAGRIEAPIGETFFVRSSSKPFHIIGGMLFLDIGGNSLDRAYFPGGVRVAVNTEDRAIYIGTLRYQRDEFWKITKVTIVDDYPAASAEFSKRFGGQQVLRKSLMQPQKRPYVARAAPAPAILPSVMADSSPLPER
jgi:hypothetical protein